MDDIGTALLFDILRLSIETTTRGRRMFLSEFKLILMLRLFLSYRIENTETDSI